MLGRSVVNSPKDRTTPLPPDLVRRAITGPAVFRTCSLVRRRAETLTAVLAVVDALTRDVGDFGIHDAGAWLPGDDPYRFIV
jgi:hypothetical protein